MQLRRALLYMTISVLSFSIMSAIVKQLIYFGAYQLVFFRALGTFVFTMGFIFYLKMPVLGSHRKLLILRAVVGVLSVIFFFKALEQLPLGAAVSIRYLAPFFAVLFAIIILAESVKKVQWLFFSIAFCGVLLVKSNNGTINNLGFLLALISALFSGLVYVLIRKIGDREHPLVIVNYFMGLAIIVGGILSIPDWKVPEGWEWGLLLSIGVLGFVAQFFMTKAFQSAVTNMVAPMKYLEVLFTVLIGVLYFGEVYTILNILGMVLIVGGLTMNLLYKR